ncbi:MAG: hypothetical protein VX346_07825 [Planctomycetota bacterium]|nr:hypothetical protein [Planctomycetota bacterium]
MKRLLDLLPVMGMVGCSQKNKAGNLPEILSAANPRSNYLALRQCKPPFRHRVVPCSKVAGERQQPGQRASR